MSVSPSANPHGGSYPLCLPIEENTLSFSQPISIAIAQDLTMAFSVNIVPNVTIQQWIHSPLVKLSFFCQVANEFGPNSKYFEHTLKQWVMHLQTCHDLYHLMKAVLDPKVWLTGTLHMLMRLNHRPVLIYNIIF